MRKSVVRSKLGLPRSYARSWSVAGAGSRAIPGSSVALFLVLAAWLSLAVAAVADGPPKSALKRCAKGDAENCFVVGLNLLNDDPPLAREYLAKACAGRDRNGCKWLHEQSEELMDGSVADQREAVGHFETACDRHYGRSCTALASALSKGAVVAKDEARAADLWQKGCDNGSRVGCRRAGSVFEKGELVARDLPRALAYYQKSCDQELESACADAGRLLQQGVSAAGTSPGSSSAMTGARAAAGPLGKACFDTTKINGDACLRLGRMLVAGEGVDKDPARGYEAFGRACREKTVEGCIEAGRAAEAGVGLAVDLNAATHHFGRACKLKSATACAELCRIQCGQGQPHACDRVKSKRWPNFNSCVLPPGMKP